MEALAVVHPVLLEHLHRLLALDELHGVIELTQPEG
jgi:hypothetical protein